jgi:hypothetical protein
MSGANDDDWRHEGWIAVAFAAGLFVVNLLTVSGHPPFEHDSVLLSDAGVNLALGHGFTATAWPGQAADELFSGNLPLYPLALAAWLKLWGFGMLQMRAFTFLCGSSGALLFWFALKRTGWLRQPEWRLAAMPTAFLAQPLASAYRLNRYDSFQMMLSCVLLAVWVSDLRPKRKAGALALVSVAVSLAGLQAAAYAGCLAGLALLWNWRAWREFAPVFAGLAAGAFGILLFYWEMGVLQGLFANVTWGQQLDPKISAFGFSWRSRLVYDFVPDLATACLLAAVTIPLTQAQVRQNRGVTRDALLAWGVNFAIMITVEIAIHFGRYYRWMTTLPLTLFAFRVWATAAPLLSPLRRRATAAALFATAALGLPAWLIGTWLLLPYDTEWRAFDRLAAKHLLPGDVVFAEFPAYFAVKARVAQSYFPGYLERMTPAERAAVNVLVVRTHPEPNFYWLKNGDFVSAFSGNGAQWAKVDEVPAMRTKLTALLARWFPEAGRAAGTAIEPL